MASIKPPAVSGFLHVANTWQLTLVAALFPSFIFMKKIGCVEIFLFTFSNFPDC